MLDSLINFFAYDLGIDLGTANTRIFIKDKGVVIREPSVVARHKKSKEIVAFGTEARKMIGRTPANLEVVRPLKDGVIADFDATSAMLTYYIRKVHETGRFIPRLPKPRVVISIPSGATEVERKAVQDAALTAGARKAYLVEKPMAAAIGANLDVLNSAGILVVDIGGGTTDLALISLGGIVQGKSLRQSGDRMNEVLANFLRLKYSLLVGEVTAEETKMEIGSAYLAGKSEEKKMVVRGRSLENGMPVSLKIEAGEVREALSPIINQIVMAIANLIEETPPELLGDITQTGICLCGGGAKLTGLDRFIFETTKISAWVAEKPEDCVVKGCGKLLENERLLKKVKVTGGLK
ncbi:MAG: Rod shape-determining protein MreB [Microgenomates group bacterium ADurb.Bin219]|nr:MAG: Rod shape-determining protein MreB [Microgenomates group bacterium ADurb.Bin219]